MCSACLGVLDPDRKVVCECKHSVCFRCAKQLLKDCDMLDTEDQVVSPPTCGFKKLGCLAKYKPGTAEAVLAEPKKMGRPKKGGGGRRAQQ
eukprot:3864770-Rhodomonas_salina.1